MTVLDDMRAQAGGAYDSLSDADLADRIYNTHYKDVLPRDEFNKRVGFTPAPASSSVLASMNPVSRAFARYVWGGDEPPAQAKPAPPAPGDDGTIQEGHEFDAPKPGTVSLLRPDVSHYMDLATDAVARGYGGLADRLMSREGPMGGLWDTADQKSAEQRQQEGVEPSAGSDAADSLLKSSGVHFTPQSPTESVLHSAIAAGAPSSIFGGLPGVLGYGAGAWDRLAPALGLPNWARVGGDLAPALIAPGAKGVRDTFFLSPEERANAHLAGVADKSAGAGFPDLEQLRTSLKREDVPPWFPRTPLSLADVGGPLWKGETERAANLPDAGGAQLTDAFLKRSTGEDPDELPPGTTPQPGAGTRVSQSVEAYLGNADSRFNTLNKIVTERSANAKPHYEAAYSHPDNQQLTSPEMDSILQTPAGREALQGARTKMLDARQPTGEIDRALSEQNGAPASNGFSMRTAQFIKEELDADWRSKRDSPDPKVRSGAGIANKLRSDWVNEMDRLDATATYKTQDMGLWRNEQGQVMPRKFNSVPAEGESITNPQTKTAIHGVENGKFDVETPTQLRRFDSFAEAQAFAQDQWNRNAPGAERTQRGEHAQARQIFSDAKSAEDSFNEGYKAIKGAGKEPDQIRSEIGERDPGDAEMYRKGGGAAAKEEIRAPNGGGGPFAARVKGKSLNTNDKRLEQFQAMGDPEDFGPFKRSMRDEATAHQTANQILMGSPSWRRLAQYLAQQHGGEGDVGALLAGTAALGHGELGFGLPTVLRSGTNLARRAIANARGLGPEVNAELARRLRPQMSPDEVDQVINGIMAARRPKPSALPLGLVPPAMIQREQDQR